MISCGSKILSSEAVESSALSLKSIDYVHGSDCLPLGVLCVSNSVSYHVLKEYFEDSTSFFVDESRDTLDSTTTSETTDGWLGDSLDVIA
ncbi:unnamed protein product [Orchesella dallaii]|uniref:Uncharacterized protein n=1 Tax=Orchesella dallaii TaxID=48710 RepID=A0ABP1RB62_9HEXA